MSANTETTATAETNTTTSATRSPSGLPHYLTTEDIRAYTTPGSERYDPLVHPLVTSLACFDFTHAPPEHLVEIYISFFEALSPHFPYAPKNLARFMPREHGKSEVGSVVIPVWLALRDPNIRILLMSETEGQAKGKLRECRDRIRQLGPYFNRTITENNKTELTLTRSAEWDVPTIKAAGFNTGITGGHFDVIVFDDLISWETQRTPARREKAWQKFQDYLNLGSEGETVYLTLGTRKHPDDLYNNLIAGPAWDAHVRRAISDWSLVENAEYDVLTDSGSRYAAAEIPYINTESETIVTVEPQRDVPVLWPERWPLAALLMDLVSGFGEEQGTLIWQREMQNQADVLQGQILTEEMLTFVPTLPKPRREYSWVAGLDPAVEDDPEKAAANDTDYWALTVLAHDRLAKTSFLVDVQRRRGLTMAQGLNWANALLNAYPVTKCLVEDAQAQRWFVQTGKDEGLPLRRSTSSGKKEDRIMAMSARFENGRVQVVAENPGRSQRWQSFLSEWAGFPNAAHDDRLDSTEIALRGVSGGSQTKEAGMWGTA